MCLCVCIMPEKVALKARKKKTLTLLFFSRNNSEKIKKLRGTQVSQKYRRTGGTKTSTSVWDTEEILT